LILKPFFKTTKKYKGFECKNKGETAVKMTGQVGDPPALSSQTVSIFLLSAHFSEVIANNAVKNLDFVLKVRLPFLSGRFCRA
jgi:hypothetical protein